MVGSVENSLLFSLFSGNPEARPHRWSRVKHRGERPDEPVVPLHEVAREAG
jgi:hypothetical protein